MKRLGRNWKRLHQLVYVAGILAVIHFLWLVKAARLYEPLIYAVILSALLLVRVPPIRRYLTGLRRRPPATQTRPTERKPRPATARIAQP
jgi:DMSO/TMAO reductase YedYZ heme-binding membrane subunit